MGEASPMILLRDTVEAMPIASRKSRPADPPYSPSCKSIGMAASGKWNCQWNCQSPVAPPETSPVELPATMLRDDITFVPVGMRMLQQTSSLETSPGISSRNAEEAARVMSERFWQKVSPMVLPQDAVQSQRLQEQLGCWHHDLCAHLERLKDSPLIKAKLAANSDGVCSASDRDALLDRLDSAIEGRSLRFAASVADMRQQLDQLRARIS